MQIFKINRNGFKEIRKQIIYRTVPIMLVAVIGGISISYLNSKDIKADLNILPILIPIILASLGFGIYRSLKRQKLLFESYTLTITDSIIKREQVNTPTISIYLTEIKEIVKQSKGSFLIKGKGSNDLIGVPAEIDNYIELEAALQKIQPFKPNSPVSILQKYQSLAGLLTIGLMLCVYTVNNKIVVGLSGSILIVLFIWSFIKIRNSKQIDHKTKRGSWWAFLLLASVIATMFFKLLGPGKLQ